MQSRVRILFHPNLSSYSLIFHFRIVIEFISISISDFREFQFRKFLSCSFNDFFAKSYPNSVIFDSVDSSLSPLSKNIKLPFLSPFHHPIWSNSKRSSEITLIPCGFDPYSPLHPSICDLILKLVSLDTVLTLDRVFSTTSWSRFVISLIIIFSFLLFLSRRRALKRRSNHPEILWIPLEARRLNSLIV